MSRSANRLSDSTRTMLESDVASTSLGIVVTAAHDGNAIARMRVTEQMVNGHDITHGGYVFLLADTTFAAACNSHGPVTVAAGAEISFVTSSFLGDELVATAHERTRYGRNGIYDVTVHRDTPAGPEVVAEFRGRSRTVGQIKR